MGEECEMDAFRAGASQPTSPKAWQITYQIVVDMEGLAYGDTAAEAIARFQADGSPGEATGRTKRAGRLKARRWPDEDLDSLGEKESSS